MGRTSVFRKSPVITVTFDGAAPASRLARSRSISTARMGAPVPASGNVSAPAPGPISTNTSPGSGWIAVATFCAHAGARKCWLNRLRGTCRAPRSLRLVRLVFVRFFVLLVVIASPVALLDFFDLLFGETEIVPDFVDQRLANCDDDVVFVLARIFDRPLIQRDLVGQHVAVGPLPLGERRALIE